MNEPATRPERTPGSFAGAILLGLWLATGVGLLIHRQREMSPAEVVKVPFRAGVARADFPSGGGTHGILLVWDETKPALPEDSRSVDLTEAVESRASFACTTPDGVFHQGTFALIDRPFFAFTRDATSSVWKDCRAWSHLGSVDLARGPVTVEIGFPPDLVVAADEVAALESRATTSSDHAAVRAGATRATATEPRRPAALWIEPLAGRSGVQAVVGDVVDLLIFTGTGLALLLSYIVIRLNRRRAHAGFGRRESAPGTTGGS